MLRIFSSLTAKIIIQHHVFAVKFGKQSLKIVYLLQADERKLDIFTPHKHLSYHCVRARLDASMEQHAVEFIDFFGD